MIKEIEIGKLYEIYQKYGDLDIEVENQYGFNKIEDCQITERDADTYRCVLANGLHVDGADYHRVQLESGKWVSLINIEVGGVVRTKLGNSVVVSCELLDYKNDLYDIQVETNREYYSNGIVSHNTTLIVDALKFMFIGKTTKTDKNEAIFNHYLDDDTLSVKGLVEFNNESIIIERRLNRKPKRSGGWSVESKLKLSKLMPDGTEMDMTEEHSIITTKELKKLVGDEDIFDLTVLTTGDNLMNLITGTPTENGKLMNSLIGLTIIEEKEAIARAKYNTWKSKKLANTYDAVTLMDENDESGESIDLIETILERNNEAREGLNEQLSIYETNRDGLMTSLKTITQDLGHKSKKSIEDNIETITQEGKILATKITDINNNIDELMKYEYDEKKYLETHNNILNNNKISNEISIEIDTINNRIETLEDGEFCKSCHQALPDVDNTESIKEARAELSKLEERVLEIKKNTSDLELLIEEMSQDKIKNDNRNRMELERDRLTLERKEKIFEYKTKQRELEFFIENEEAIIFNNETKLKIDVIKTKIIETHNNLSILQQKQMGANQKLSELRESINRNNKIFQELLDEANKEKVYSTYIKMVGRNGITKLVIRSILPIINNELERIMDDTINLKLELDINDKNDIEFNLIDGDVKKSVKTGSGYERTVASLALRCVLTKVSQLPTPNFIVFDEIFGKVSPDNYEKIELLFDRVKDMFDTIFLIVHDERLTEWGDNSIMIKKTNNISSVVV